MLFMLFPVVVVVLGIAAVLFVVQQLLVARPAVAQQHDEAPPRADGTPAIIVDSTARPTDAPPARVPEAEGQRA